MACSVGNTRLGQEIQKLVTCDTEITIATATAGALGDTLTLSLDKQHHDQYLLPLLKNK